MMITFINRQTQQFVKPDYRMSSVADPGLLFGVGVGGQQIQLRTEDRQNGDLGAVAP